MGSVLGFMWLRFEPRRHTKETTMAVKDPVCGMTLEEADAAATEQHGGTTYYFCSADCAEEFRNDPESYI